MCVLVARLPLVSLVFFFLMIRRPPRSTLDRSSAASDVYKRQGFPHVELAAWVDDHSFELVTWVGRLARTLHGRGSVSYTHLRAHETVLDLVCRLLLEKKKRNLFTTLTLILTTTQPHKLIAQYA